MQRRILAAWIVLLGLVIGLLGSIFFYHQTIGLSFPIFITLCVVVMLATSIPAQSAVNRRNLWLLLPVIFFAVMFAIRADPLILFINFGVTLLLAALALHFFTLKQALDEATIWQQIGGVFASGLYTTFGAIPEVTDSWTWLRARSWQGRAMLAVARGVLLAVPIIVVFTLLLGSADAVFAGYVSDVWEFLSIAPMTGLVDQGIIALTIGWLAIGTLGYGLARRTVTTSAAHVESPVKDAAYFAYGDDKPLEMEDEAEPVEKEKPKNLAGFRLGLIESSIILGLVDLLFAAFVLIQLAYFFGGENTLAARGLTYSEYARRGFFELVAVSALTLGLALWLDHVTVRREARENRIFRALSIVIVALTSVMLVSASQRMTLYEEAFGFTHLRVYTHVSMLWLGILFGVFLLSLFRAKKNVFSFGMLLVAIGYLGTLNLMDVDLYIAERNIARYEQGYALDLNFLSGLSVDAVPAIIPLHEKLKNSPDLQEFTGQWLIWHLHELDSVYQNQSVSLFSANLSRGRAWDALDAMRAELPEYNPYFMSSSYDYFDVYADRSRYSSGWDLVTPSPSP